MRQHKWHKEIVHWANGGEVQVRWATKTKINENEWFTMENPAWCESKNYEYRIKPQHKCNGFCGHYECLEHQDDCIRNVKPQPKEPQYLYAFLLEVGTEEGQIVFGLDDSHIDGFKYIGKINLEVEE